jgi:cobalt-zinc-cadmium efflux system outer membrane protein
MAKLNIIIKPAVIFGVSLLSAGLLTNCGFQTYQAKPVQSVQSASRYLAHDPNNPDFHQYLITQGYPENQLPIKQWGLRELTLSALFFHPQLDLARAQWRAAVSGEISAAQKPNLGVSTNIKNHSQHDGGISPWTYGLGIDIPVETAGKRQARIDRATSLSEAARIEIAQTAWQVRSRLANSLIEYSYASQRILILQKELDLRNEIVAMLEKRLSAGMASSVEMSNARLQLQKTQQVLDAEKGRIPELRASLASNVGLSVQTFIQLPLVTPSLKKLAAYQTNLLQPANVSDSTINNTAIINEAQQAAMLNRLDIRAALARYAAAEAKLRLEIARQYPDIVLSPSYSFDQGDKIWSLGLSTLLTLINKNSGLIAEARALREVEAAQFDALQANVISELSQVKARYLAALNELDKAQQPQQTQQIRTQQIQRQFDAGLADRLELTTTKLESLLAEQNIVSISYKTQRAIASLEDVMQRPIEDTLSMPANLDQAVSR